MKKKYRETKHSEGHFLPWVPLCEQHVYEQLFQPLSPSAANLTRRQFCDDLKFIFVESRHNFLSATNNKRLLFELVKSNLTHNNGPFLDTFCFCFFFLRSYSLTVCYVKALLNAPRLLGIKFCYMTFEIDVIKLYITFYLRVARSAFFLSLSLRQSLPARARSQ